MKILVNSTSVSLWHEIIHEAETSCATVLNEELEAYLVFMLMRYLDKPEIVKDVMAEEFMEGLHLTAQSRELALRGVGDKCLLFSGLFPSMAEARLVKISYFVNLGQSAYGTLSKTHHDLYGSLATQFVKLMDILQSIRHHNSDLLPFQAYDLWNETGSQRALTILKQYTQAMPISTFPQDIDNKLFK